MLSELVNYHDGCKCGDKCQCGSVCKCGNKTEGTTDKGCAACGESCKCSSESCCGKDTCTCKH
ncbi:hypothetical protein, no similarity [Maudiozyma saulgeensis]|uniref:Uncharacterized protein n=1 Tax=Maudiozyma saulgeensis TaxID=1789683 RepID=A0A1X7QXF0_9SACH|nr:hypothetical protein, no similarity [Kazachstania saulgeensis]